MKLTESLPQMEASSAAVELHVAEVTNDREGLFVAFVSPKLFSASVVSSGSWA